MPVLLTRLPDEPIIVATLHGRMDKHTVRELFDRTRDLAEGISGRLYRISDFTQVELTFADMASALVEARYGGVGATTDPRLRPVMVAPTNRARLFANIMQEPLFGGVSFPVFETVEEALGYARLELAQSKVKALKAKQGTSRAQVGSA
jgi:hypothetical protein